MSDDFCRSTEALVERWWLLIPGRDMRLGSGIDRRVELDPPRG